MFVFVVFWFWLVWLICVYGWLVLYVCYRCALVNDLRENISKLYSEMVVLTFNVTSIL